MPVLVLDVDEAEADKLLLTLDPLAGMAEKNSAAVEELLKTVSTERDAVGALLDRVAGQERWNAVTPRKEVTQDAVPAPPASPVARPGDLWIIGANRLLCGDSTNPEAVQRLRQGQRAALRAAGLVRAVVPYP